MSKAKAFNISVLSAPLVLAIVMQNNTKSIFLDSCFVIILICVKGECLALIIRVDLFYVPCVIHNCVGVHRHTEIIKAMLLDNRMENSIERNKFAIVFHLSVFCLNNHNLIYHTKGYLSSGFFNFFPYGEGTAFVILPSGRHNANRLRPVLHKQFANCVVSPTVV